jgi:hypothetical protein
LIFNLKPRPARADHASMESPLRPGQDIVLSSHDGAVDCKVVAVAGHYVLLKPQKPADVMLATAFTGRASSLTYLDGMVPTGLDGDVEQGSRADELRFRVTQAVDRRSSVRVPVFAQVVARLSEGDPIHGQVLDVSAGGMRFRHPGKTKPGEVIRLRAELPGGLVVDAEGIVRTMQAGVTSVEFIAMHGATSAEVGEWTVNVLRAHLAQG